MSRGPSSFVARFALLALPLITLTYTVSGAHLALQPPISPASADRETRLPSRSLQQARSADTRGLSLPNSCSAGPFECPTDDGGSLSETSMLLQCSISQDGKLQCIYGDLTGSDKVDRVLGGAVGSGGSSPELGSEVVPSTDICTYDLVSAFFDSSLLPLYIPIIITRRSLHTSPTLISFLLTFDRPTECSKTRRRPSVDRTLLSAMFKPQSTFLSSLEADVPVPVLDLDPGIISQITLSRPPDPNTSPPPNLA